MKQSKNSRTGRIREAIDITASSNLISIQNNNSFYCGGISHISFDAVLTSQNDAGNGTASISSHTPKHKFDFTIYGDSGMFLHGMTRPDGLIYSNSNMVADTWHFEFSYVSD